MKWLGTGEGDGIIKVEMDRGPHRSQDDATVGYVFQRPPDPEFPSFGPKQLRWIHGDDSIIDNHDKWKYPVMNTKVTTTTPPPPNTMSYISHNTTPGMPGLYDMGQHKSISAEQQQQQQYIYMPNQLPGNLALHPQQYHLPQNLIQQQQLHQPLRHQQQQIQNGMANGTENGAKINTYLRMMNKNIGKLENLFEEKSFPCNEKSSYR